MKDLINKTNKLHLTIFIILVLGLAISVYLVMHRQTLKSKASLDVSSTLYIDGDQDVNCSGDQCTTESNDVTIYLKGDPNELFSR